MNGDDSICMKSPAKHVLVENSLVRQGNGLVIGTSDEADFLNITFRNCTAINTAFGCHIKFKDGQAREAFAPPFLGCSMWLHLSRSSSKQNTCSGQI